MFELAAAVSYPDLALLGRITRRERLDALFEAAWSEPTRRIWTAREETEGPAVGLVWCQDSHHPVSELPDWLALCLAVRPDAQRRGIGRSLMSHLQAEASRCGASRVRLFVASSNQHARALYASLGFVSQTVEMRWEASGVT